MKKKWTIAGIIAVIASALVFSGCGRHHHDPEDKADYIVHKIGKKLDLDDTQKAKLETVKNEFLQQHKKHKADKKVMMEQMMQEVAKPAMDSSVLLGMINAHTTMVEEAAPSIVDKLVEFHASLNDEQRKKLTEHMAKFKRHHHDG